MRSSYLEESNTLNLRISSEVFSRLVNEFQIYLRQGIAGEIKGKFLKSRISTDLEIDLGEYLSLDIGGSNLRCSKIQISTDRTGNRIVQIKEVKSTSINNFLNSADNTSAEELFSRIVNWLPDYFRIGKSLGLSFSFPIEIGEDMDATISRLWKISVEGFMEKSIGTWLNKFLEKRFSHKYRIIILNDSVAGYLAGMSQVDDLKLGVIVGTGFNIVFVNRQNMIIDSESGHWKSNLFEGNFEQNVSGKYLVNIFHKELKGLGIVEYRENCKSAEDLNQLLYSKETPTVIKDLIEVIIERSAHLMAVQICGYINELNIKVDSQINMVADGSVFWKFLKYQDQVRNAIDAHFDKSIDIHFIKVKNSTLIGAGIALAMCTNES